MTAQVSTAALHLIRLGGFGDANVENQKGFISKFEQIQIFVKGRKSGCDWRSLQDSQSQTLEVPSFRKTGFRSA